MVAFEGSAPFGPLVRRHRLAAGLSQEELAERARLSRRGISDLERGARRPLPGTIRRIADALGLVGEARDEFMAAGQWRNTQQTALSNAHADGNLPVALSTFIGRERDLEQVRCLLETNRLLTLTGTGGIGKTRLALEAARAIAAHGTQRAWLVELAPISESTAVARATAAALGLPEQPGRSPLETLTHALRSERLLLILDNCEQVIQGCAEVADAVLRTCPGVSILATSRERLGIEGEMVWRVPSMSLPADSTRFEAEFNDCDAARLFIDRATKLAPDFVLSDQNAPAVARLLNRLDGIPLAIELAAAQLPALGVQQIADRLDDALQLLVGGTRRAPPRQQTLRAAIDWSYGLLDPTEKLLFERLSVFAGGWTLEAAEHVCTDRADSGDGVRVRKSEVVELHSRLVTRSLVTATPNGAGGMRYRLLETLRQYGRERLTQRAEAEAINDRHADYFVSWAHSKMHRSSYLLHISETSMELDNVRQAVRWLIDLRDSRRALQLGAALRWYWFPQGRLSEGAEWYAHILALPCQEPESEAMGQVLAAAALIAGRQGKSMNAVHLHERAIALWRLLGDDLELATSLSNLGYVYRHTGQLADARRCFDEGIQLSEGRFPQAEALNRIGLAESLYDLEQYEHALSNAARALELQERLAIGGVGRAWTKRAIGLIHYQRGAHSLARQFLEESLADARNEERLGWWLADALASVAQLDVYCSRFDRAHQLLSEGLQLSNTLGDRRSIVRCLERMAYLAAAERQSIRALRLAAAADALRTQAGLPRSPVENRLLNRWLGATERALNPTDLQRVHREAAMMQVEQVLEYALGGAHAAEAAGGSQRHDGLTRREREVVRLVSRGLSNEEIASSLVISERTVESHVSSALRKLALSSRAGLASWAARHEFRGGTDVVSMSAPYLVG